MRECTRCGAFVLPEPKTAEQMRAEYAEMRARDDNAAELRRLRAYERAWVRVRYHEYNSVTQLMDRILAEELARDET